jgi:hypothetical protein
MKQHAAPAATFANCVDVLNDPCFVVDVHDRHELCVCSNRRLQITYGQEAVTIGLEPGHLESLPLECSEAVGNGLVFRRHRDQVAATVRAEMRRPGNREVVRLGCAGGENQRSGNRVQEIGDLPACAFDQRI